MNCCKEVPHSLLFVDEYSHWDRGKRGPVHSLKTRKVQIAASENHAVCGLGYIGMPRDQKCPGRLNDRRSCCYGSQVVRHFDC